MVGDLVDRAGHFDVFGLNNSGHLADHGASRVLGRIDPSPVDVLKQQSISLRIPGRPAD